MVVLCSGGVCVYVVKVCLVMLWRCVCDYVVEVCL